MKRRAIVAGGILALYGACRKTFSTDPFLTPDPEGPASAPEQKDTDTVREAPTKDTDTADTDTNVTATSSELKGLKIAFDVGHSATGDDLGAFGNNLSEHKLNTKEVQLAARALRKKGAQVTVFYYHESVSLVERGQNSAGNDIFISVHHNAFGKASVQGTETLVNHPEHSAADQKLAQSIQKRFVPALWGSSPGEKDRGAKPQPLGVLRSAPSSVAAAVLTEAFFITAAGLNASKADQMVEKAAQAIADGVEDFWSSSKTKMAQFAAGQIPFEPWEYEGDEMGLYRDH